MPGGGSRNHGARRVAAGAGADEFDRAGPSLRTNQHCTLKTHPLQRTDLDEFVACYHAENPHDRSPTWSEENAEGRWRAYDYTELVARDKASLDLFWLRDQSLEEFEAIAASLEPPAA